jgi:hypothetical protein
MKKYILVLMVASGLGLTFSFSSVAYAADGAINCYNTFSANNPKLKECLQKANIEAANKNLDAAKKNQEAVKIIQSDLAKAKTPAEKAKLEALLKKTIDTSNQIKNTSKVISENSSKINSKFGSKSKVEDYKDVANDEAGTDSEDLINKDLAKDEDSFGFCNGSGVDEAMKAGILKPDELRAELKKMQNEGVKIYKEISAYASSGEPNAAAEITALDAVIKKCTPNGQAVYAKPLINKCYIPFKGNVLYASSIMCKASNKGKIPFASNAMRGKRLANVGDDAEAILTKSRIICLASGGKGASKKSEKASSTPEVPSDETTGTTFTPMNDNMAALAPEESATEDKDGICGQCSPDEVVISEPNLAKNAKGFLAEHRNICNKQYAMMNEKFTTAIDASQQIHKTGNQTWRAFLKGSALAGAAVVGTVLIVDHMHDKKDKKKAKQRERDFQNGIAITEEGQKLNCLTQENYLNKECQPVMFNYCGKTENVEKAGCVAFNVGYCNTPDSAQAYCISGAATTYCKKDGVTENPSCQWLAARPASCAKEPNNISCLTKMTPDELTAECPKYPNDPLCLAHVAGKVVSQPTGSTWSSGDTAYVGKGGRRGTGGSLEGITTLDQASRAPGKSLWQSNSSAYGGLCASGQLKCK